MTRDDEPERAVVVEVEGVLRDRDERPIEERYDLGECGDDRGLETRVAGAVAGGAAPAVAVVTSTCQNRPKTFRRLIKNDVLVRSPLVPESANY